MISTKTAIGVPTDFGEQRTVLYLAGPACIG